MIKHRLTLRLALLAVLAGGVNEARAQYGSYYPPGYGGFGFGGWGSTYAGDVARGLGYYAAGAGQYNLDTAVAAAINANTLGQWNQYLYLSQMEANIRERAHLDRKMKRDASASTLLLKRLKENPTPEDIASGNALNVILDQLADPRIQSSALRTANSPIRSKVVRAIPFTSATDAITISLDELTAKDGWPAGLRSEVFAPAREAYEAAVHKALKEDEEGDLSEATANEVRTAARQLQNKLDQFPPKDPQEAVEAKKYVKMILGLSRMLGEPRIDKILAELDTIEKTTLGSLLAFMHTFNLRFGASTTAHQRAVYQELYPVMAAQRDRIMKDAGLEEKETPPPPKPKNPPTDFFEGMHLDHLEGSTTPPAK